MLANACVATCASLLCIIVIGIDAGLCSSIRCYLFIPWVVILLALCSRPVLLCVFHSCVYLAKDRQTVDRQALTPTVAWCCGSCHDCCIDWIPVAIASYIRQYDEHFSPSEDEKADDRIVLPVQENVPLDSESLPPCAADTTTVEPVEVINL